MTPISLRSDFRVPFLSGHKTVLPHTLFLRITSQYCRNEGCSNNEQISSLSHLPKDFRAAGMKNIACVISQSGYCNTTWHLFIRFANQLDQAPVYNDLPRAFEHGLRELFSNDYVIFCRVL